MGARPVILLGTTNEAVKFYFLEGLFDLQNLQNLHKVDKRIHTCINNTKTKIPSLYHQNQSSSSSWLLQQSLMLHRACSEADSVESWQLHKMHFQQLKKITKSQYQNITSEKNTLQFVNTLCLHKAYSLRTAYKKLMGEMRFPS